MCVCVRVFVKIVSVVAVVSAIERRLPLQQINTNGVISSRRRRRLSLNAFNANRSLRPS